VFALKGLKNSTGQVRGFVAGAQAKAASTAAAYGSLPEVTTYPTAMKMMHWGVAGGIGGCVVTVQMAMATKDMPTKIKYMTLHKSFGLTLASAIVLRLGMRAFMKVPGAVPGTGTLEHIMANAGHTMMYGLLTFMPASGIAMGYYGGKGIPFFGLYTIPGAEKPDGEIAKWSFKYHKLAGQFLEYVALPLHIGAATQHVFRGHNVLHRIIPGWK